MLFFSFPFSYEFIKLRLVGFEQLIKRHCLDLQIMYIVPLRCNKPSLLAVDLKCPTLLIKIKILNISILHNVNEYDYSA